MRRLPLILLFLPLPALADSAQIDGLNYPRITIQSLRDGKLLYTDRTNRPTTANLDKVTTLELDEYPLFTQAETLVSQNQPKQALPLYIATLAKMNDKALQPLIKARALRALDQSGDFKTALEYFWDLYAATPTPGTFSLRPQKLPASGSKMLAESADFLASKISDPRLKTPESVRLLQGYLLEIYQQNKDPRAAALARQLATGNEETPTAPAPAATQPVLPAPHQQEIQTALAAGHFPEALQMTQSDLAVVSGPAAIPLYTFKAQALVGLKNPAAAAVAYLRIAAYYPEDLLAASEAIYQAAQLLEPQDPAAARRLYREIAEKYPQTPHARSSATQSAN